MDTQIILNNLASLHKTIHQNQILLTCLIKSLPEEQRKEVEEYFAEITRDTPYADSYHKIF